MTVEIRPATCADGPAIARIGRQALGEDIAHEEPRVQGILREELTFVATGAGEVLGFVSNFLTRSAGGAARFELDLLAVAPEARGRGIGGRLVSHSLARARKSEARRLRALVAAGNLAMQRICKRHHFTRSDETYGLYVAEARPPGAEAAADHGGHLVQVDTLAYSGIWLEGAISPAAVEAGFAQAARADSSRVGAVIPKSDRRTAALLFARRFEAIGDYHWWTISL